MQTRVPDKAHHPPANGPTQASKTPKESHFSCLPWVGDFPNWLIMNVQARRWGFSSVVECLPSKYKALGSVFNSEKKKKKQAQSRGSRNHGKEGADHETALWLPAPTGRTGRQAAGLPTVPTASSRIALAWFVFSMRVEARVPPCWTGLYH